MVAVLQATKDMQGLSYMTIANQLAAAVSRLPETLAMKSHGISAVSMTDVSDAPTSGVHLADGSVYTGYYKNWGSLSKEDRQKVLLKRAKSSKGRQKSGKCHTATMKANKNWRRRTSS